LKVFGDFMNLWARIAYERCEGVWHIPYGPNVVRVAVG